MPILADGFKISILRKLALKLWVLSFFNCFYHQPKVKTSVEFIESSPSLDNQWRAIILFGRNTASYKFALAKALIELAKSAQNSSIPLEVLATPFAKHLCEHLMLNDKQATSSQSQFLTACRRYNNGEISESQLQNTTVRLGFNNVLDAFHTVNQDAIPAPFFTNEAKKNKSIQLTDAFYQLLVEQDAAHLALETEARWRLVETAWDLNINKQLIAVHHDLEQDILYVENQFKRTDITSSRSALNGYQKGHCFYCFDDIVITPLAPQLADVDHFIPHTLKPILPKANLDGVWNLVLSCPDCNRGMGGKSAKVPSLDLLKRLHKRNEYLIGSHHPLRETLIRQTGQDAALRQQFLQQAYTEAKNHLIHIWQPMAKKEALF